MQPDCVIYVIINSDNEALNHDLFMAAFRVIAIIGRIVVVGKSQLIRKAVKKMEIENIVTFLPADYTPPEGAIVYDATKDKEG